MPAFTDSLLSVVGRISSTLLPMSSLMDKLVVRLAPETEVQACPPGTFCMYDCVNCAGGKVSGYNYYAVDGYNCIIGNYNCVVRVVPCGRVC